MEMTIEQRLDRIEGLAVMGQCALSICIPLLARAVAHKWIERHEVDALVSVMEGAKRLSQADKATADHLAELIEMARKSGSRRKPDPQP